MEVTTEKGLLKVDKPADWTSFDVVNKVRSTLEHQHRQQTGEKKRIKVGHSGTLDPFATGLLLVAYGKCTKELNSLLKLNKTYIAKLKLGASSTTGDVEGEITELELSGVSEEAVTKVLETFTGKIQQTPPQYSAIKVDGQPAYKKARKGEKVELTPREVEIYELKLLNFSITEIEFEAKVSSGTYIRVLGEDIARALGTEGYLTELRRSEIGEFGLDNSITPNGVTYEQIKEASFDCTASE